jgi:hypothetical protein
LFHFFAFLDFLSGKSLQIAAVAAAAVDNLARVLKRKWVGCLHRYLDVQM